jgi:hypothetical protein
MMTNLPPKNTHKFACVICDLYTSNSKDYNKHLTTSKHKEKQFLMSNNDEISPKTHKLFNCVCGKIYKHRQGLHVHKKSCNFNSNNLQTQKTTSDFQIQLMLEIIKDNKEFKELLLEQNKQMIELTKQAGHNTTNNTTNNNSNNKFNINLFLNEKCKDALNIQDFISQLDVGINDLEETGRLGFAEGISKIFINGLNQLEFYDRPIHCNDGKREVLYIKSDDKWTKEEDSKPILTNAIKQIAHKNMKQISEWQKINTQFSDPESKQNDKYLKLVSESMSGSSKEESEKNYNKIIKKLVKETVIPLAEK